MRKMKIESMSEIKKQFGVLLIIATILVGLWITDVIIIFSGLAFIYPIAFIAQIWKVLKYKKQYADDADVIIYCNEFIKYSISAFLFFCLICYKNDGNFYGRIIDTLGLSSCLVVNVFTFFFIFLIRFIKRKIIE